MIFNTSSLFFFLLFRSSLTPNPTPSFCMSSSEKLYRSCGGGLGHGCWAIETWTREIYIRYQATFQNKWQIVTWGVFFDLLNTRSCSSCSRSIPASLTSFYTPSTTITLPYTSSHYSSFNVIVEESANKVDNIIQVGMNSLTKYLNLTTASASLLSWRRFTPVLRGLCRFPLLICNWAMQQF